MTGSEKALTTRLCKHLKTLNLDPVRIENVAGQGTPDINLSTGAWIEAKYAPRWPVNSGCFLKLPHPVDRSQKAWLLRRSAAYDGRCFVCLQVDRDYLLFDAQTALKVLGKCTRAQLITIAMFHATSKDLLDKLAEVFGEFSIYDH